MTSNNIKSWLACLSLILIFLVSSGAAEREKQKSFSLFTVVTFANRQCTTLKDSTIKGSCLTSTECEDQGGQVDGNCASGFGVCCKFIVQDCGDVMITKNCTYVQNPSYNAAWSTTASTTCTFNVVALTDDICQIRYDFDEVVLQQPASTGDCTGQDSLTVTSPTGRSPPVVCGTVTGTHMYAEVGMLANAGTLVVAADATSQTRKFSIKITQIECTSVSRAPSDCVQYFTTTSGTLVTYNFGAILRGQLYDYCIRQNHGFCTVDYWQDTSVTNSFQLDTNANSLRQACTARRVQILSNFFGTSGRNRDTYCGIFLNSEQSQTTGGVVRGNVSPFRLTFLASTGGDHALRGGFTLKYNQVPCGQWNILV